MMTFKRFLSLILAAAMCLSMLPVQVFASDEAVSNAVTGYDPESGKITVAEVPADTVTLILAGYAEEQMVFALPQDASDDSPVTWSVPVDVTFDTLKVFFLDGNSAPVEDALQVWPELEQEFYVADLTYDKTAGIVSAEVNAPQDCTVTVEFWDEDQTEKLTEVSAAVTADTVQQTVELTPDDFTAPDYFLVTATLFDADGSALCEPYLCYDHTAFFEEFQAKTVEDFDSEQVLQLTEETDNNFMVAAEDTVILTMDDITSAQYDESAGICRIYGIGPEALRDAQRVLVYSNTGIFLVDIGTVSSAEGYVDIAMGNDSEVEDFFDFIKLDLTAQGVQADSVPVMEDAPSYGSAEDSTLWLTDKQYYANAEESPDPTTNKLKGSMSVKNEDLKATVSFEGDMTLRLSYHFDPDNLYFRYSTTTTTNGTIDLTIASAEDDWKDGTQKSFDVGKLTLHPVTFILAPGITATATPSVPIKLTLDAEVTMGVSLHQQETTAYSTNNGWSKCKYQDFSAKAEGKITAALTVGLNFELALNLLQYSGSPDDYLMKLAVVLNASFIAQIYPSAELGGLDTRHLCALSLDGSLSYNLSANVVLKYKLKKNISGKLLEEELFKPIKVPLGSFHISILNDKDSPYGGKLTFDFGECKNVTHRTLFTAVDQTEAHAQHALTVYPIKTAVPGDTAARLVNTEDCLYLYDGSYYTSVTIDGTDYENQFTVNGNRQTVNVFSYRMKGTFVGSNSGDPLAGVTVYVDYGDGTSVPLGTSDSKGKLNAAFSADPSSNTTSFIVKVGENTVTTIPCDFASAFTGEFDLGHISIEPTLSTSLVIGWLTDDTILHRPVAGAKVSLYRCNADDSLTHLYDSSTTDQGQFFLTYTEAGEYRMTFEKTDYVPFSLSNLRLSVGRKDLGTLEMPYEGTDIGSVFGKVTDPDGNPIPATVELCSNGEILKTVTCDESGNYSFDKVPFGAYTVAAYHPEYHTESDMSTQYFDIVLDTDLYAVPFTLIKTVIADFYVHSGGTNLLESGRFSMANKAATASWTVTASHAWTLSVPQNDWLSVSTASDAAGETALTLSALNGSSADRSVILTFAMGENTYIVTVSQKAYAVRGTITDGSEPVSGASVVVWNSDFRSTAVTTGADGSFSLPVPDGSYSVTVTAEGYEETTVAVPTAVNLCDASVSVTLTADNSCGDDLTWSLDENGLLVISGTGPMYHFVDNNAPWYEQRYSVKKLQVEEGVTTLGHYAFKECGSLAEVSLPSTLTSIGNGAFTSCYGLKTFPIPAGLTSIGHDAFYWCGNLAAFQADEQNQRFETVDGILFNKGLTTLIKYPGGKKFEFSGADASYEIPDGVQTVCAGAFEGVMGSQYTDADGTVTYTGIQQLYFPASVTDIPWSEYNGIYNSDYIPHLYFAGVAPSDNNGYSYSQEAAAVIHFYKDQTADVIDNAGRSGWTSPLWVSPTGDIYQTVCEDAQVTASGKVTDANGTPLEGVTVCLLDTAGKDLPVYCITDAEGVYAFQLGEACSAVLKLQADDYGLTTVDVVLSKGENTLDTVVLTKTELVAEGTYYSAAWKLDTNGVLTVSGHGSISYNAWQDYQTQVTEIRIESGITRVTLNPWGDDILRSIRVSDTVTSLDIGLGSYLETFTEILVDENNPTYTAVDGVLYSKDGKTLICYPCGKSAAALTVQGDVIAIGDSAFSNCANLQTVTFPASLTVLGTGVFTGCDNLSVLEVASGSQTFTSQDGVLFSKDMTVLILYPPAKSSASYVIPDSVTTLQGGIDSDSLKTVTLGASLTDLGGGISSSSLTTIIVSSGNAAYTVQDGVLFSKDMTTLICYPRGKSGDTYTVPDTVTALASNSLYHTPLKTVILPAGLDSIDAWALAAYHLENVYFYGPVPSVWEKYAFGFPQSKLFLNYIEGTNGWTSPTWTDLHGTVFNTTTFTP